MREYLIVNDDKHQPRLEKIYSSDIGECYDFEYENCKDIPSYQSMIMDEVIYEYLIKEKKFDKLTFESNYIIAFYAGELLGGFLQSKGSISSCSVFERNLFTFLLLIGADSFYSIHNHPSGSYYPSEGDIETTEKLTTLSDLFEIAFLDSYIVSKNGWAAIKAGEITHMPDEKKGYPEYKKETPFSELCSR